MSIPPFKPGDRVVCIDGDGLAKGVLVECSEYTVTHVSLKGHWLTLADEPARWSRLRFVLAPSMPVIVGPGRAIGDGLFDETTVMVADPVSGGEKGQKSARFDLIPPEALSELAVMYGKGAEKYAGRNWEKGYAYCLSFGAMLRHSYRWFRGEDNDPETGVHHMAAVAFHAFALMTFQARKVGTDDRPAKSRS